MSLPTKMTEELAPYFKPFLSETEKVQVPFDEFEVSCPENATFRCWRIYMELVSILLRFTYAFHEGDWELFLISLAEVPLFGAINNFHSRWGAIFLADMRMLPTTAPEVHKKFYRWRLSPDMHRETLYVCVGFL